MAEQLTFAVLCLKGPVVKGSRLTIERAWVRFPPFPLVGPKSQGYRNVGGALCWRRPPALKSAWRYRPCAEGFTEPLVRVPGSHLAAATEPRRQIVAFSASDGVPGGRWRGGDPLLTPLAISLGQRLDDVLQMMRATPMGGTDCSLPMRWALQQRLPVDTFVVLTDSETWAGPVHPVQALRDYRERMGISARLVVEAFVSNGFSIADPDDAGMLDVVGMDAATPQLIADFAADRWRVA